MCLAVPAEVLTLAGQTATVSVEGALRDVNVSLVDDLEVGDYVLVHAGFALQRWTRDDYLEWKEIMSYLPGDLE
jgi:hydrogenase expression/formation protein HypC